MKKLNIFIDGTWLFKVCGAGSALPYTTDSPDYPFFIDWEKFDLSLKQHVEQISGDSLELGIRILSTSIFSLPTDFESWPRQFPEVTEESVRKTKAVVYAKNSFVQPAIDAGYSDIAVFRPLIKNWIISKLERGSYQEKQVDTTVVALLVKSAITRPEDYHAVVAGDADIIPAIKAAYPEYTKNVVIVSTHPDELDANRRQSSFSYLDFEFEIDPFFLQENAKDFIHGDHVYRCVECGKILTTRNPIPARSRPRCRDHKA